jgi:16S rRNA (guanine527-N7)-methyltransferase
MQIGSKEWSKFMIDGAGAFGLDLDDGQTGLFAIHAAELVKWNQKINLTAVTDPLEIAVKHFLDSLLAARFTPKTGNLLDIGSGGGFPGLPLKVFLPSLSVTLIDASRKKVSFLKHVIRTLKLNHIEALHGRAEDLTRDPRYLNRFDGVVSRAVSSLKSLCRLALPVLIDGGVIIALKGDAVHEELAELQNSEAGVSGNARTERRQISVNVEKYRLPLLEANRSIVIIRRGLPI